MPYYFCIVGPVTNERLLANPAAAVLAAYAMCSQNVDVTKEAYLSAFEYGEDFKGHMERTHSTRGFAGECGASWIWWDIDSAINLFDALNSARKLVMGLRDIFAVCPDQILVFFSGSKGFHIGIPTVLWDPDSGVDFHLHTRHFCETIAQEIGVMIDTAVYDKVRAFRAPNSRHPRTGLHKHRLTVPQLLVLDADAILSLAANPIPFEIPVITQGPSINTRLRGVWNDARSATTEVAAMRARERDERGHSTRLNRTTLDFIRYGADEGRRHMTLYSSARNLSELGCPDEVVVALLIESALDSGLAPTDSRNQINGGIRDAHRESANGS